MCSNAKLRRLEDGRKVKQTGTDAVLLLSMFDGGSNMQGIVQDLGITICGQVVAESDSNLQRAVAGEHGFSADDWQWSYDYKGVPTIYLQDVWNLFRKHDGVQAKVIR